VVTVQRAFRAKYAKLFVPPLPCDLADLKARITAAVKNIDAPMCAVSSVMHTSNISSCQKKVFLWL